MHIQRLTVIVFILTLLQSRLGSRGLSVIVDQNSSASCDSLWGEEQAKYCDSLQQVLSLIANTSSNAKIENIGSFVDVQIAAGDYELADPVTIEHSIILRAKSPGIIVKVTLKNQTLGCNDSSSSCHALLIKNVENVTIEGIIFDRSEGIMTFENVSRVAISNSKFR